MASLHRWLRDLCQEYSELPDGVGLDRRQWKVHGGKSSRPFGQGRHVYVVTTQHGTSLALSGDARDPGFGDAGTIGGSDEAVAEAVVNLVLDVALVAEVGSIEPVTCPQQPYQ